MCRFKPWIRLASIDLVGWLKILGGDSNVNSLQPAQYTSSANDTAWSRKSHGTPFVSQRVQLESHYGTKAQKPYVVWYLLCNFRIAL